jgi:hypothetical protein
MHQGGIVHYSGWVKGSDLRFGGRVALERPDQRAFTSFGCNSLALPVQLFEGNAFWLLLAGSCGSCDVAQCRHLGRVLRLYSRVPPCDRQPTAIAHDRISSARTVCSGHRAGERDSCCSDCLTAITGLIAAPAQAYVDCPLRRAPDHQSWPS